MKLFSAMSLALAVAAAPALASKVTCDSGDQVNWKSQDEIKSIAASLGYDTRRVKTERGCYEVYAISPDGKKVEAFFNPVSGDLVGVEDED